MLVGTYGQNRSFALIILLVNVRNKSANFRKYLDKNLKMHTFAPFFTAGVIRIGELNRCLIKIRLGKEAVELFYKLR